MASLAEIQAIVQRIHDDLPFLIQRSQIAPKQVVVGNGLSDISERLGLIQAGEFRSGNGIEPGLGFSGVRIGYPAFLYDGELWNIAGIDNDTIQVGLRASDGKFIGGGGAVVIDGQGVFMQNSATAWFNFEDANGNRGTINIAADPNNDLEIVNIAESPSGTISLIVKTTDDELERMILREDPSNVNVLQLSLSVASGGNLFNMGNGIGIWAGKNGKETVFNDDSFDINFRIETNANANGFFLDAGDEYASFFGDSASALMVIDNGTDKRVEIAGSHFFPSSASTNPKVIINFLAEDIDFQVKSNSEDAIYLDSGSEILAFYSNAITVEGSTRSVAFGSDFYWSNIDTRLEIGTGILLPSEAGTDPVIYFNESKTSVQDFVIRGDVDDDLLHVDVDLNTIGIGGLANASYKLKVYGDVNITGGITGAIGAETNANDIYSVTSPGGASLWTGTISGAPSGTSVTVSAPVTGTEAVLVPTSTNQLGKMRIYNLTRGNNALISNYNTATNVITLTSTVPANWANGDSLTVASQTVSGGGVNWVDIQITSGPTGKRALFVNMVVASGTVGDTQRIHPTESFGAGKVAANVALVASQNTNRLALLPITSTNMFSLSWTGTPGVVIVREAGFI